MKWPTVIIAVFSLTCLCVFIFKCIQSTRRYKVSTEYTGLVDSYMKMQKKVKHS